MSFRNLFLALPEQPVPDGGNLIAIVERCHVLHGAARLREHAACLPLDEVDIAALGYQFLGQSFLFFALQPAESTLALFSFSTFARSLMPPDAFWSPPATM